MEEHPSTAESSRTDTVLHGYSLIQHQCWKIISIFIVCNLWRGPCSAFGSRNRGFRAQYLTASVNNSHNEHWLQGCETLNYIYIIIYIYIISYIVHFSVISFTCDWFCGHKGTSKYIPCLIALLSLATPKQFPKNTREMLNLTKLYADEQIQESHWLRQLLLHTSICM